MAAEITSKKTNVLSRIGNWFLNLFRKIGRGFKNYFVPLGQALVYGDIWTKLSFLIAGFGFFFHGQKITEYKRRWVKNEDGTYKEVVEEKTSYQVQWLRGVFFLMLEALFITVICTWGVTYLSKISFTGLAPRSCEYIPGTFDQICTGDSTFLILLYSILTIMIIILYFFIHLSSIKQVYKSQKDIEENKPILSWKQDLKSLLEEKFYWTGLTIPIIGVLIFSVVPILFMVCIAFTNYDSEHMPPAQAFSWVGWTNFANVFGGNISQFGSNFMTVFWNQLGWTLIWAVCASITCFIGGLLLALLLNSKRTRITKVWRTMFVLTIAVPQFVSLMLIRYMLDDYGIVNNLLKSWGWISTSIPFLSDPTGTKVTVLVVNMWIGFPYLMLMISGILMNIPADLYESARIDGAGRTKMFWSITMPYILQVCTPYLINQVVGNINNFNVIYLLTADYQAKSSVYTTVNAKETDLLITWLFNITQGSGNRYYLASVIGIFTFIVSTIITLLAFTQTTKGDRERRLA